MLLAMALPRNSVLKKACWLSTFLGRAYFDGNGVEQNYAESAKFFQKAVDEFDLHSYDYYDSDHPRWLISRCPVVGRETRLFELVFEYIYDAWYHLGVMYWHGLGVAQNYEKAVEFFRQATEERNLGIHWDGDNHYWDVHYPVEAYSMLGNAITAVMASSRIMMRL